MQSLDKAPSRREFMMLSATSVVAVSARGSALAFLPAAASPEEKWMNEPKRWHREGETLVVTADPKTDF